MAWTRESLKNTLFGLGADLVGVADTKSLEELETDPPDLLTPFTRAVAIAVHIPRSVFEPITEHPTPIYASIYQTVNRLLDDIAFGIARRLDDTGYRALPVPASQVLDRNRWRGAISHKAVARMAGLGWQGKNLLLITPQYGSRVRLVTVLTDAPVSADGPVANRCGRCHACVDACPVGAIKGVGTADRYQSRNQAMHFSRCVQRLTVEHGAMEQIGAPICGICINVCPFGRFKRAPSSGA